MRQRILWPWIVGFAFAVAGASMNCGGDDNNGTGTGGTAGSTGGKGGTAGSAGSTMSAGGKGGSGGTAGSGGGGTAGKGGGGSGGTAGSAGSAGTGGGGAKADAGDSGPDAPTDSSNAETSTADVRTDAGDSAATDAAPDTTTSDSPDGSVAFAAVTAIFNAHCVGCHKPRETGAQLLDLQTADGLYTRLTTPLPDTQEGKCGFPPADAGDDGGDGGDGAVPPNRQPIVPGDTGASLLYLKVAGTQPTGCGVRMPRVNVTLEDGGTTSVACNLADGGASNCLSQAELDTIGNWITQGAPNN